MPHKGERLLCLYKAKLALSPFLAFPCHSQLPETCRLRALGRAKHPPGPVVGAEGSTSPCRSRWPGLPISGIGGAAAVALPLFSLGRGSNCLQLPLPLPRVAGKVQPQRVRRGFRGFPSVLMLTGVSVWSGSGRQAWAAGATPTKPNLLLLATQVA